MPKLKTHKASHKRIVRVTSTGLIITRHMSVAHRARFKSKRAKQLAGQTQVVRNAKRNQKLIQSGIN